MQRFLFAVGTGLVSTLIVCTAAFAAPLAQAQSTDCPIAGDDVVSAAVGAPATINPTYDVTVDGSNTECLFTAGGHLVLVRQDAGFFDDRAASATPEQVDQLRLLIDDDLDYAPVSGVGDAAFFATVRDRSLAPQRLAVLISKRGADAFVVGVMDTPQALDTATALTQAVLAQPAS